MTTLNEALTAWLEAHADGIDTDGAHGDALLARLAGAGLFLVGVPLDAGGSGGPLSASVRTVAALAEQSLGAAFVFWAQRAVIECLLASPNRALAGRLLPALLDGRLAGAPGLSNAMKSLGGLERLRVSFAAGPDGLRLDGAVPWATNLHPQGFVALVAAGDAQGDNPSVFAIPHGASGVRCEPDLDLLALCGTHTAALRLDGVPLDAAWQLHPQARVFLPAIRPAFVGLQCGLGLGLGRAAIAAARRALDGRPSILDGELAALEADIEACWQALSEGLDPGLDAGRWRERPRELLSTRLRMAGIAAEAVALELQALGGRALLRGQDGGYARRAREAAFLAVVTPTVAQLKNDLARQGVPAAPPANR